MIPFFQDENITIYNADVMTGLAQLPDESVQCVVTSPPYWGLRDYGTGVWIGGDESCPHKRETKKSKSAITGHKAMNEHGDVIGDAIYKTKCHECGARRVDDQLGLEETPEEYVEKMVAVFEEVRRVLKKDGTLWLNMGDSYSANPKGSNGRNGINKASIQKHSKLLPNIKIKDLVGIPWMLAFALRADGWYLRNDIIWAKPNPMPESVRDRCTRAHEYIFHLTKSARYFYDADAIREPIKASSLSRLSQNLEKQNGSSRANGGGKINGNMKAVYKKPDKQRGHSRKHSGFNNRWDHMTLAEQQANGANKRTVWTIATKPYPDSHFATFPPGLIEPCIFAGSRPGDIVLDPFWGSGTTGEVAVKHGRKTIGIELNPDYCELSLKRFKQKVFSFQ